MSESRSLVLSPLALQNDAPPNQSLQLTPRVARFVSNGPDIRIMKSKKSVERGG
jgi:hypothetical protein